MLKAKPGQRDEVRRVWEKYARDYIAGSALSFYYCYDDNDPGRIIVFGLGDQATSGGSRSSTGSPTISATRTRCLPSRARSAARRRSM